MNSYKSENRAMRVLQIAGGFNQGVSGGVAAFVNNYYRYIDKQNFSFDFLSISYQCFELYRNELEAAGGKLFCLDIVPFNGIIGRIKLFQKLPAFLREHRYDIIHVNMGSLMNVLLCSYTAKKHSNAKVIAHSHNVLPYSTIKRAVNNIIKPLFMRTADYFFSNSKSAAQYMFPRNVLSNERFLVLKNAIDYENYQFNESRRAEYRNIFSFGDELVICHIGRFNEQKNHIFMIDIFLEVYRKNKRAKLLLIGTGELLESIKDKATSLGLEDHIILAGQRKDVHNCLQAADVFLFPSLFEGLGIVVIEAQAAGLPVLASDKIPNEAKVTSLFHSMSLSNPAEAWADKILEIASDGSRKDTSSEIRKAGYDIKTAVKILESVYEKLS